MRPVAISVHSSLSIFALTLSLYPSNQSTRLTAHSTRVQVGQAIVSMTGSSFFYKVSSSLIGLVGFVITVTCVLVYIVGNRATKDIPLQDSSRSMTMHGFDVE